MSIAPLKVKNTFADSPLSAPKYSVQIKDRTGDMVECADPRATRALLLLMNQHAVIGGAACHWGGPSAMAETMSALHQIMFSNIKWYEYFNFVNDIGHAENGIYALRANLGYGSLTIDELKGFRSIESRLTGHGESHLYPEGVLMSNGPLGSALPQAQGLALADAASGNLKRVTVVSVSDGASMEGEAKEAFAAIAGFAHKGQLSPFVMIVSDNNTKLSGRITDSFSMQPSFESLKALGWNVMTLEDGHNLEKVHHTLDLAIEMAKNDPKAPICLWVKTVKGKGLKSTEESSSGGHGYPLKAYDPKLVDCLNEIYAGQAPAEFIDWAKSFKAPEAKEASGEAKYKVQQGIADAMIEAAKKGSPVFSVSSDLQGSTGVAPFHKEFPKNSLDIGIAESNMVSTAAGLSRMGYIPVVDTFAAFGITKGNLPLVMANLSESPIIAVFSHTGFQDAADGASHQSTTYISAVASIPNTDVYLPTCSGEAKALMSEVIEQFKVAREQGRTPRSSVFFIGRETFPENYGHGNYDARIPLQVAEGSDGLILAYGPMLGEAIKASQLLRKQGKNFAVASLACVNNFEVNAVRQLLSTCNNKLVTVEDHQAKLGAGSLLTHTLSLAGVKFDYECLGVKGVFGRSAYKASELYEHYGIGHKAIVEKALNL